MASERKEAKTVFVVVVREIIGKGNRIQSPKHYTVRAICATKEKAIELCQPVLAEYGHGTAYVNEVEMDSIDSLIYSEETNIFSVDHNPASS
jgi:hypothetical protein